MCVNAYLNYQGNLQRQLRIQNVNELLRNFYLSSEPTVERQFMSTNVYIACGKARQLQKSSTAVS